MITITRSLARTLRAVLRRAGIKALRGSGPRVLFHAGADGLRIKAMSQQAAIEYHLAGVFPTEQLSAPLEFLEACEGSKPEPVMLEARGKGQVAVNWSDRGIPQLLVYDADRDAKKLAFPELPESFATNEPGLWQALRDAAAAADHDTVRYALDHIQLRGATGQIVATDGRQLLRQSGFEFPWADDVLIPASRLFAGKELSGDPTVQVGKTDSWVAFQIEPWTIWLAINKEARFPKIDSIVPKAENAVARLALAPADAQFLLDALPGVPDSHDTNHRVTLELNGHVAIRGQSLDQPRPTELILTNSRCTGAPVAINTNRHYIAQAIKLGFNEVCLYGPEKVVLCDDGRRQYVWMLLDAESVIKPNADAIRVESPPVGTVIVPQPQPVTRSHSVVQFKHEEKPAYAAKDSVQPSGTDHDEAAHSSNPIVQAEALRSALRDALGRTNDLIAAIKRQKRQHRLVQSTLESLKELGRIAA